MIDLTDRRNVADGIAVACAAALALSPFCSDLTGAAKWNAWLTGYAAATVAVAARLAEAPWAPRAQLALGAWVLASIWLFDLWAHEAVAAVHAVAGVLLCVLAAAELRSGKGQPPWQYRPGAAARAPSLDRVVADARRRSRAALRSARATRASRAPWRCRRSSRDRARAA